MRNALGLEIETDKSRMAQQWPVVQKKLKERDGPHHMRSFVYQCGCSVAHSSSPARRCDPKTFDDIVPSDSEEPSYLELCVV